MGHFDRYLLGQLTRAFGFFALILVAIYWVNRAVLLLDTLLADGQSALVFLEFTALALPGIIRITLPLAAFAGALYVTNRLASDSELVVMQATGFSAWRLARPVAVFGLLVAVGMLVLTHVLGPMAQSRLERREAEVAQNLAARLLTAGQFRRAAAGVTVFVRAVTPAGELEDVFLSDRRAGDVTYTARRAYLLRSDQGPQLVMVDGLVQQLVDGRLSVTRFDDLTYNVAELIPSATRTRLSKREISTSELLRAAPDIQQATGHDAARLVYEAHSRSNQAFLAAVAALVGFVPLLFGGFSRFGLGPQMGWAVALVITLMAVDGVGADMAQTRVQNWPFAYLSTALGLAVIAALLATLSRPRRLA